MKMQSIFKKILIIFFTIFFSGTYFIYATDIVANFDSTTQNSDITTDQDIFILGNVAIGTTILSQNPLTIKHDVSSGGITVDRASNITRKSQISFRQYDVERYSLGIDGGQNNTQDFFIWDGDASSIRFYINSDGNVGIGTTDPGKYRLYVAGQAYSTGGWTGSDMRWKKDITPLKNSLNSALKLQGVYYYWNTDAYPNQGFTDEKQIGLIAQDVEKIIPELVHTNDDGYKSVSYEKLTAVLVEAVKGLKAEKDAEINSLKVEINELRTLIKRFTEPPTVSAYHKKPCTDIYEKDGI